MATRTTAGELARLLNSLTAGVYVLDEDRRIVFCNRALAAWVGREPNELMDQRCEYRPPDDLSNVAAAAAGLCPPPDVLAGIERRGTVTAFRAGTIVRRQADFIHLAETGASRPVLVVVAGEDSSDGAADATSPVESESLHALTTEFRREFAAKYQIDRLIGNSPAMRRVRAQVLLAGSSAAPVSIYGPPGSGKQFVAKAIHYRRYNADAGLAPLDCAVVGAEALTSTLTLLSAKDQARTTPGGSTLLLRELDKLPADAQAILAEHLAGSRSVRVIATSTRPLFEAISTDNFRQDLAHQLTTLEIELVPLAKRIEDLPLVAQMLIEQLNAGSEKQIAGLAPEVLDHLALLPWPRNIDELAEMLTEAQARAAGPEITLADLPDRARLAAGAVRHSRRGDESIVLDDFLSQIERELIERAIARAKGNKSQAARLLGLTRPKLYRRLIQLGMIFESES